MKVFGLCIFELMFILGQAREMFNTSQIKEHLAEFWLIFITFPMFDFGPH